MNDAPSIPGVSVDGAGDAPLAFAVQPPGAAGASFVGERPEVAVGAAFAGGLVLALILKRLAR
ncbi:MAG: hypothetical protein ACRDMX_16645 [Solirubrobacteraceae bacterium]